MYKAIVIEDDVEEWQDIFHGVLKRVTDFKIEVVADYPTAIRTLDRQFFHIAVVDMSLVPSNPQDQSGIRILRKIQRLAEGTESLLVSAHLTPTVAVNALKGLGASHVMEKHEFDPAEFAKEVRLALNRSRKAYEEQFEDCLKLLRAGQEERFWTDQVLRALKPRAGYKELRSLLDKVLKELYPLLYYVEQPALNFDSRRGIVTGIYWSKYQGMPVSLTLGDKEEIEAELRHGPVPYQHEQTERYAGIVRVLPKEPFERFLWKDSIHILVVEADPEWQETLKRRLEVGRRQVALAKNESVAMSWLDSAPFDLMIVDSVLDERTGVRGGMRVLEYAREHHPEIPAIVVSEWPSTKDVYKEFVQLRVLEFFQKQTFDDRLNEFLRVVELALQPRMSALEEEPVSVAFIAQGKVQSSVLQDMELVEHIKIRLATLRRNRQILKTREALYGIDVPLRLTNEIKNLEAQIDEAESELREVERRMEPSS